MSGLLSKTAKKASEFIYKSFGTNSGNMLLVTSILGFTLSSGAQIAAILMNKHYSMSQKAFMVPQELGELIMATSAIFLITKPMQKLTLKMVKTGKFSTKEIVNYMKENNLLSRRGKMDFDFEKEVRNIIKKVQLSDEYVKSNSKEMLINSHKKALNNYKTFADSTSALTTTAAGLVTTGLVVPVVRNRFGAYYQKQNIDIYNNLVSQRTAYNRV